MCYIEFVERKNLRKSFGQFGDVSPELTEIFGNAYLDAPDDTTQADFNLDGFESREVSGLISRKIESVEKISCKKNQELLATHLLFIRTQGRRMNMDEGWQTTVHSPACPTSLCHELHIQACVEDR